MEEKVNVNMELKKKLRTSLRNILNKHFIECEKALASEDVVLIEDALILLKDKYKRLKEVDDYLNDFLLEQLNQESFDRETEETETYRTKYVLFCNHLNKHLQTPSCRPGGNFSDDESSSSQPALHQSVRGFKRESHINVQELHASSPSTSQSQNKRMREEVPNKGEIDSVEEIDLISSDDDDDPLRNEQAINIKQEVDVIEQVIKTEVELPSSSEILNNDFLQSDIEIRRANEELPSSSFFQHENREVEQPSSSGYESLLTFKVRTARPEHERPSSSTTQVKNRNYKAYNASNAVEEVLSNDEFLLKIFDNLELPQLINIERVCKKWQEVSLKAWKSVFRMDVFDIFKDKFGYQNNFLTKNFDTYHLIEILRRSGKYLTYLDLSYLKCNDKELALKQDLRPKTTMELINTYCHKLKSLSLTFTWEERSYLKFLDVDIVRNLTSLTVGNEKFSDEYLPTVLLNAINLESFSIAGYDYSYNALLNLGQKCKTVRVSNTEKFTDQMLEEVLRTHPNIQNLDVTDTIITQVALKPFTRQLTALALLGTERFLKNLKTVIKFPNLKTLDLSMNHEDINGENFRILMESCPMIWELRLKRATGLKGVDFKYLENLIHLMYLDVSYTEIPGSVLISLARKKHLKQLFCEACNNVSRLELNEIVDVSPELTYLAISCSKINKKFVRACLGSLEKRQNNVSLIVSLRGTEEDDIPDKVKKLKLKDGIRNWSKTSALNVTCGIKDQCGCDFYEPCVCFQDEEILVSFN